MHAPSLRSTGFPVVKNSYQFPYSCSSTHGFPSSRLTFNWHLASELACGEVVIRGEAWLERSLWNIFADGISTATITKPKQFRLRRATHVMSFDDRRRLASFDPRTTIQILSGAVLQEVEMEDTSLSAPGKFSIICPCVSQQRC